MEGMSSQQPSEMNAQQGGNANNFMSSLLSQMQQQQQQQGAPGASQGLSGGNNNQVPLLIGASPLQQLQGLMGGGSGNQNNQFMGGGGQGDQQGQQNQGLPQSLFFGAGMQGQQNQGLQQQQQHQQQQQPGQQQGQLQQPNAAGGQVLGMMQNPLLGANLGFNVQQLQQLQLAQQLMAAGLPPQLAFGGQPFMGGAMGGLGGFGQNPQLAALASNPVAGMGLAAPNAAMGGQVAAPNIPSSSASAGQAAEPDTGKGGSSLGEGQDWAEPFSGKGKKEPPFPLKLHQILSNPEFQECICWNPHGRSWRILKPPVFEQLVIPLYFRHAKYASFMRQVNGWGFKRIVSGNDHNSYYHELFLRDYPQVCLKMKRIRKGDKLSEAIEEEGKDDKSHDGAEVPGSSEQGGGGGAENEDNQEGSDKNDNSDGGSDKEEKSSPEATPVNAGMKTINDNNDSGQNCSAMPGINLSGVGGSNQNQAVNASNFAAMASQFQNQQNMQLQQQSSLGGGSAGGISGLDNAALMKLQEALQAGAGGNLLQLQQNQQQQQNQMPSGLGGLNLGNLSGLLQGNLGGALAAQLQAATQPPQPNNFGGNSNATASSGPDLNAIIQQLQQQQQNANAPSPGDLTAYIQQLQQQQQQQQTSNDGGSQSKGETV